LEISFLALFYLALLWSKTPFYNSTKEMKLGGGRIAHKSTIGEG